MLSTHESKEQPGIPFDDADLLAAEVLLACPSCGYNYTHVESAVTALGQDPHEGGVAYEGTIARGVTQSRRDCLVITVRGECDHRWEIRFQQHKGNTLVSTRSLDSGDGGQ